MLVHAETALCIHADFSVSSTLALLCCLHNQDDCCLPRTLPLARYLALEPSRRLLDNEGGLSPKYHLVTDGAISCYHPMWPGITTKGQETITKGKNYTQFLINSTKCPDSGLYWILLQNEFGEAHYDIYVHVSGTDSRKRNPEVFFQNVAPRCCLIT